ncbi:MAG: hypothetical protein U1E11_10050, partial [Dethiobacteria bacterium]|nr:hypothetical protein [Dethiobacteria bacterium]
SIIVGWNYASDTNGNKYFVWRGADGSDTNNVELSFSAVINTTKTFSTEAIWFNTTSLNFKDLKRGIDGEINPPLPLAPTDPPTEPPYPVFIAKNDWLAVQGDGYIEDPTDPTGPTDPTDPTDVLSTFLLAPPVQPEPPVIPAAPVLLAAAPPVATLEVAPEETNTQPEKVQELEVPTEEPQVVPESRLPWWPLLLLLIPGLLWFLLARLVLVRVPDKDGEYETVARKLARRKDKRWYVDIEKELDKYLAKYGVVMVDFRGGLIKDAKKAVYSGDTVLSTDEMRYAIINKQRYTSWVDELKTEVSKTA